MDEATRALLETSLSFGVPLWILRCKSKSWDQLQARAQECGQIVAEKGDIIMYRSKKKGETAAAFNALVEGLAILAFSPGGVTFMGMHFEAVHPESPAGQALTHEQVMGWRHLLGGLVR